MLTPMFCGPHCVTVGPKETHCSGNCCHPG